MKKRIGGITYDTEKAQLLAEAEAAVESTADFGYYEEALYRDRRGRFFLAGYGGPMTVYARKCEDGAVGWGEAITPLPKEAVIAWCEKHHIDPEEEGFAHLLQ